MNYNIKSLKINAALNGMRQGLNFLYPIITFPYISRVLSVNSVGIYNFSNTYISYFMLIAALGISTYAVREGAKYRENLSYMNEFASQIFTINILTTIISYILLFLTLVIFKNLSQYYDCILVLSLQIFFTTIGTEWIYTIYEDYAYITIRSIFFKVLSLILLFTLVRNKNDYLAYAWVTIFASVGSNILNFVHVKNLLSIKIIKNVNLRYHLKPILIIFLSSVAITLYVSSDTTVLGIIKGNHAVGVYSTATKIYAIVVQLMAAVVIVTIPRLSMLFGKKRIQEYQKVLGSLIELVIIIILPSATGLFMLSKEVVVIIGSDKYIQSSIPLKILAVAMIFSILNTIVSNCILIPMKKEIKLFYVNLFVGILNVTINIVLIPYLSYIAAAITTMLCESIGLILNIYNASDVLKKIIEEFHIMKNIIQSLIGCLVIVLTCFSLKLFINNIILLTILSISLSIISYTMMLLLVHNKVVESYFYGILTKLK